MAGKEIARRATTLPSTDFSKFEAYLTSLKLPTENIIASPEERVRIMSALPEFIESLPEDLRRNARYLSKFIAGSAVGLFDASLNFVWNEVINNLRKKIVIYGLDIFYDEAVGPTIRDQYNTEDDLSGIKDKTLLDTCLKLELITDIVYKKMCHILDMRNDIGASHPTTYSINSYELLGWLQTCINEVLKDEISSAAITIKSVVDNIKRRTTLLDEATIETFKESLSGISISLVGNLLVTLFGIFVSNRTDQIVRENILLIAPIVWEQSKDEKKYDIGISVDNYKANLDEDKVRLAETFFEKCDGNRYLSLPSRSIILSKLCDELTKVHDEWDNYYHEVPLAKNIMSYIKRADDIPEDRQEKIIRTIMTCRIGREVGYCNGVSQGAKGFYDAFLKLLNKEQVVLVLQLLNEPVIRSSLYGGIRTSNLKELLNVIKSPLLGVRLNEIIEYLIKNKKLETAMFTKEFKELSRGII
jgi:hypothetical protein